MVLYIHLKPILEQSMKYFSIAPKLAMLEELTRYHPLGFSSPTKGRLGVSKKVLKVLLAQGTSKLQHHKIFALLVCKGKCHQKL